MELKGKNLLVLAGAGVHSKIVNVARKAGVHTIVTDNVINSPAKLIADKAYDIDIFDIDGLFSGIRSMRIGWLNVHPGII